MDLSRLPAKLKRHKDWLEFTNKELQDQSLREPTLSLLARFHSVITTCWDAKTVSESASFEIADLERQLEQLNQEARLRVPGRLGSKNS